MKRWLFLIFLAVAILISFSACGKAEQETTSLPTKTLTPFVSQASTPTPTEITDSCSPENIEGTIIFQASTDFAQSIYSLSEGKSPIKISGDRYAEKLIGYSESLDLVFFKDSYHNFFTVELNGENLTQLTDETLNVYNPKISLEGEKIVFSSGENVYPGDLYILDIKTSEITQLTKTEGHEFSFDWDPSGENIVYISDEDESSNLYLMNFDDGETKNLTDTTDIIYMNPIWSPDGKYISFLKNPRNDYNHRDIYLYNIENQEFQNLTNTPTYKELYFQWTKDSKNIMYVSKRGEKEQATIINIESGESTYYFFNEYEVFDINPILSPNSSCILFKSQIEPVNSIHELYLYNPDSQSTYQISNFKFSEFNKYLWIEKTTNYEILPTPTLTSSIINEEINSEFRYVLDNIVVRKYENQSHLFYRLSRENELIEFLSDEIVVKDYLGYSKDKHSLFFNDADNSLYQYDLSTDLLIKVSDQSHDWGVLSPDGKKIVYVEWVGGVGHNIFIYDIQSGSIRQITEEGFNAYGLTWDSTSSQILYYGEAFGNNFHIINVYTGIDEEITNGPNSSMVTPSGEWSPDEKFIAYQFTENYGNYDIYISNIETKEFFNLTQSPNSVDRNVSWSPDGTKIAYVSSVDFGSDIFIINIDGTGKTRLTNNGVSTNEIYWTPDGKYIFFSDVTGKDLQSDRDFFGINIETFEYFQITDVQESFYNYLWIPEPHE